MLFYAFKDINVALTVLCYKSCNLKVTPGFVVRPFETLSDSPSFTKIQDSLPSCIDLTETLRTILLFVDR